MKILLLIALACIINLADLKSTRGNNKAMKNSGHSRYENILKAQNLHSSNPGSVYEAGYGGKGGRRRHSFRRFLELKKDILTRFASLFRRPFGSYEESFGHYRPNNQYRSPYISLGEPFLGSPLIGYPPRTGYNTKSLKKDHTSQYPHGYPQPRYNPETPYNTDPFYTNRLLRPASEELPLSSTNPLDDIVAETMSRRNMYTDSDREVDELQDYIVDTDYNPETEFESLYQTEELERLNEDVDQAIEYLIEDQEDVENLDFENMIPVLEDENWAKDDNLVNQHYITTSDPLAMSE